jgi:hypothetical protein
MEHSRQDQCDVVVICADLSIVKMPGFSARLTRPLPKYVSYITYWKGIGEGATILPLDDKAQVKGTGIHI